MPEIPRAVLSEQFEARLKGRRLRSALFFTYQFEPAFFEQQVLPVFLDVSISHAEVIRLVQLEDVLRNLPGEIAVYYDANGLNPGDGGSARLDVRRIPIRHRTGIFHAKNVFLLLESQQPDEDGHCAQALLVASLSSNLTRAGWWENVECCHVEEIAEGESSRLRDGLKDFLESVRNRVQVQHEQRALRDVLGFLRAQVEPRHQKSLDGRLHTHFYSGGKSLPDFLDEVAGQYIRDACLEIISPYFDDAPSCGPLEELVARFRPKEVRVFLPRSGAAEAQCRPELFEAVRALPDVDWGHLPDEIVRVSRQQEAGKRRVHAKLYRFFTSNPKREIVFVGSANLTRAAHQEGGNWETGFLVDRIPARRPEFWLTVETRKPSAFQVRLEDEASAGSGGSRLNLTYHWDRNLAVAYWDSPTGSGQLRLSARGSAVGTIGPLPARTWAALPGGTAKRVADMLGETSLFTVHGDTREPVPLLVQEEGMSHKPSLLFNLSAADILRYWALLTPAQRAAFLEARAPEIALAGQGADLVARVRASLPEDTLFDRFAGMFHAFGCLERNVREALDAGKEKVANYRLFGRKYDSLGSLLERIGPDPAGDKEVDHYVILMCARQLVRQMERDYPAYWAKHGDDVRAINRRFDDLGVLRERLVANYPGDLGSFLDWFDRWFLKRAEPVLETGT